MMNGRLLGRITIDDVIDVIREDAEHSMMSMAGLDDDADTFAPVLKSTQQRSIWLGVNLFTALAAVMVSSFFEEILAQMAILAVLNTLVPSMGGVAGGQTLTLVIRGMALGHIGENNAKDIFSKELAIGFLNGLIWAIFHCWYCRYMEARSYAWSNHCICHVDELNRSGYRRCYNTPNA